MYLDPMRPKLSNSKQVALARHLHHDPAHLVRASDLEGWADVPPFPYRPCATLEEFEAEVRAQHREFPDGTAEGRVIGGLAMYAGVAPEGAAATSFTLASELDARIVHPTARARLSVGRAAKLRAIPSSWQRTPFLRTPIIATSQSPGELELWFDDGHRRRHLATANVLEPIHAAPLAYTEADDTRMTINPIQVCPLSCAFCIRVHTGVHDFGLVNFSPGQTVDYVLEKYEHIDWTRVRTVKLITGAFTTFESLLAFCAGLADGLRTRTRGDFDPTRGEQQTLHVLTDLGRTRQELEALKDVGVRSFEHTIEIIDDHRRRRLMTTSPFAGAAVGKGTQRFADCVAGARAGVETWGDAYAVALVVGMDDLCTTMRGFAELVDVGVTRATTGILVPNAYKEFSLFEMSFSELMQARRAAARWWQVPLIYR